MGTGYVRNDTGNNIADGNVINASDLDGEFDAIVAAFNSSTGHTHDGTSEEGAPITKFGPSQEVEGDATALFPASDGVTDLGKSTKEWKDLYIDGVINTDDMSADAATITGNVSVGGTLNVGGAVSAVSTLKVDGNTTLGGELSVSATATFSNNIIANGDVVVASGIEVGAIATFSALTNFTTNVSVGGTLVVTGDTDITNLSANGTLDVSGNASVGGTLAVTGDTDVTNLSANGTLDVSGNGSVGGTFNVEGDLKNNAGNLTIAATSYIVEVKGGGSTDGAIQLNCRSNSHGQTIKSQDHSAGVTNTMLLPRGADSVLVSEVATQTLTNKTLTSPAINGATIDSAVSVSAAGAVNVGTTLAVVGDTDVSNLSASGTFDVGGNASVGGTLAVTGDTDVTNVSANGTLDVSGNASVGGTLAVTNTITGSSTVSDQDGDLRDVSKSGATKSTTYTLADGDQGNFIQLATATAVAIVPNAVFNTGDIVSIVNTGSSTGEISCTITSAIIAGADASTATMTLGVNGVASILFLSNSGCIVTGNIS